MHKVLVASHYQSSAAEQLQSCKTMRQLRLLSHLEAPIMQELFVLRASLSYSGMLTPDPFSTEALREVM